MRSPVVGALWVVAGSLLTAWSLQSVLTTAAMARPLVSDALWSDCVHALNADIRKTVDGLPAADVAFTALIPPVLVVSLTCWFSGALFVRSFSGGTLVAALAGWGWRGWRWWLIPGCWELLRTAAWALQMPGLQAFVEATVHLFFAITLAGWWSALLNLCFEDRPSVPSENPRLSRFVIASAAAYVVVFVWMNWQLYFGLLVPHGDSAMYEEHLWNLWHGKGFRSYLDQGLFLGEHMQFIHVFLLPLHVVWPSQLMLELCESLALASGSIGVWCIATRCGASRRSAALLSVAWLLAIPLQFLDIAIDLKTFRPTSLGVPLLLFAFDRAERGRLRSAVVLMLIAVTAKEEYALILAPFGVYLFLKARLADRGQPGADNPASSRRSLQKFGILLAIVAAAWLVLSVKVLIPAFRQGAPVHYYQYFGTLASSPAELMERTFDDPAVVFGRLFSPRSLLYTVLLLMPVGFLSLRSPGRLAVGLPLFGILCLLDLRSRATDLEQMLVPFHHFHAPLVPVIFWAAASALGRSSSPANRNSAAGERMLQVADRRAAFAVCSAAALGLFLSMSPAGISFWDPGHQNFWRTLYVPGPRAHHVDRVLEQVPISSRVASTDYIHTRLTHHERSYDYSVYRRAVNNYEEGVPPDTEFIVIDTRHKYSTVRTAADVRELQRSPDQWELLPDKTDGYFIILKQRSAGAAGDSGP